MKGNLSVILGLKGRGHDSAASVVIGGLPVAAMAQERFDRTKHSRELPFDAIKACLKEASVGMADVDAVAVSYDFVQSLFVFLPHWLLRFGTNGRKTFLQYLNDRVSKWRAISHLLRKKLGYRGAIYYLDHHDCHAASTFFTSSYENAAILSVDGKGEYASTVLYAANGHTLHRLKTVPYPHSLGTFYSKFTQYLGFCANRDEGKVMALAGFSKMSINEVENIISTNPDELYRLDLNKLLYHLDQNLDFAPEFEASANITRRLYSEAIDKRHMDLAHSVQKAVEDTLLYLCQHLYKLTSARNLCLTGGVCLNAVANGRIALETPYSNIHIFPAATDDGTALGAALLCYTKLYNKKPVGFSFTPFLGTGLAKKEISKFKNNPTVSISESNDLVRTTAELLAKDKIVGWYQGRAEFGPRALGNRSIFASPISSSMKEKINSRVKFREEYRPYGACILLEDMNEYFLRWKPSPYMNMAFAIKETAIGRIPAVVHVDGTSRVQTVDHHSNRMLRNLLLEFKRLTGLGVLLNTSLNSKGEPIANSLSDAIQLLLETHLDYLVADDNLLTRRK